MNFAVDKERRCTASAALQAILHVFSNPLQVNMIVYFGRVARHIELQPLGVTAQLVQFLMCLVFKQQIMHGPEPALSACTLRCFRSLHRMRMDFFQREVAVNEPYPVPKAIQE